MGRRRIPREPRFASARCVRRLRRYFRAWYHVLREFEGSKSSSGVFEPFHARKVLYGRRSGPQCRVRNERRGEGGRVLAASWGRLRRAAEHARRARAFASVASDPAVRVEALRREIEHHTHLTTPLTPPRSPTRRSIPSCARLRELEAAHRACRPTRPTQRVGGYVGEQFAPVRHARRMYSLDNADGSRRARCVARSNRGGVRLRAPDVLRVEDRRLVHRAHLRGRGLSCGDARRRHHRRGRDRQRAHGEKTSRFACAPRLFPPCAMGSIELRGEVYMPKSSFNALNEAARGIWARSFRQPATRPPARFDRRIRTSPPCATCRRLCTPPRTIRRLTSRGNGSCSNGCVRRGST